METCARSAAAPAVQTLCPPAAGRITTAGALGRPGWSQRDLRVREPGAASSIPMRPVTMTSMLWLPPERESDQDREVGRVLRSRR